MGGPNRNYSTVLPFLDGKRGQRYKDLAGKRFGRLVAMEPVGRKEYINSKGNRSGTIMWLCQCDCGNTHLVRSTDLTGGSTQSCGCFYYEVLHRHPGANRLPPGVSAFNQFFASYQRSAKKRGYSFELTEEVFRELVESPCYYCGDVKTSVRHAVVGTNGSYHCIGIDRIDNMQGYTLENVRPCCKQCNIAKGILSEQDFRDWIYRAHTNLEQKA